MIQELETNFTKIPNQLIDDTSISDKAKVTYIKMRRCAPSWTFSVRGLAKVLKKSIGTISSALKELEEKGYIERQQTRDEFNRFGRMKYTIRNTPCTDNLNDNKDYISDNTNSNNSYKLSCCLTTDLRSLEEYLGRDLTPSEKEIWKRWQSDWKDPRIIKHAIYDNEFREKIRFSDVNATLNRWKELGLNTLKEVYNFTLEMKYKKTKEVIKKRLQDSDKEFESVLGHTEVGKTIGYRDFLLSTFHTNRERFLFSSESVPIEVFKYLPDEMLDELINYYDKTENEYRKEKAIEALERCG